MFVNIRGTEMHCEHREIEGTKAKCCKLLEKRSFWEGKNRVIMHFMCHV